MIKTIETKADLNLATIVIPNCGIAKGIISVDLHEANSTKDQTIFECFSDLLLSGTKSLSREELLDKVNSLGSSIDAQVSGGILTIEISSTQKGWKKTLAILSDILSEPAFSQTELKRATKLAFNNLNDEKEDSKAIAYEAFKNNFFAATDRRSSTKISTLQENLSKLTNKDVKEMYARMYKRPWTASVTGDKSVCTSFSKLVTDSTEKIKLSDLTLAVSDKTSEPQKLVLHDVPSRQNLDINIGCPVALKLGDAEFSALVFGISVLAKWGGFAGRLMSTVREKEGLTYGIYGRLEGYSASDNGYLRIGTFFSPAQVSQGLQSTFREIKKIHEHGITHSEYKSFPTIMETQSIMRNDSPISSIRVLHEFSKLGCTIEQMNAYEAELQSVTKEEINAAIKKYLNPKNMTISAAGPTKGVEKELHALCKKL